MRDARCRRDEVSVSDLEAGAKEKEHQQASTQIFVNEIVRKKSACILCRGPPAGRDDAIQNERLQQVQLAGLVRFAELANVGD